MVDGRYIYRIVPAAGQDPIRLEFTDEDGQMSNSDNFVIELNDLYQMYDMTIYAGALNPDFFRAVITFPDKSTREMKVGVQPARLTIRDVTLEEDPTTAIRTEAPISVSIFSRRVTSLILGMLSMTHLPLARTVAGMMATAAFFAPPIFTEPWSARPPVTTNLFKVKAPFF